MKPPRTLEEALVVIARLLQRIADLEAKVAALEEQRRQSSQNSSRPPSTDPPTVARPPARPPSGRRPGAQPGHEAQARALVPVDQVDHVIPQMLGHTHLPDFVGDMKEAPYRPEGRPHNQAPGR